MANALTKAVKVAWISAWAGVATFVLFWPVTIAALASKTGNLAFTLTKWWACFMLFVTRVQPTIRFQEKIDPRRSYIIISNHQSNYDILALVTTLGIQFRWIIKKEIRKVPLFGYALYLARNIFIDRGKREEAIRSMKEGLARLPAGVSVMCFAEGTRSPDGRLQPFKKGGFIMAIEKGLPILPVVVNGSRKVMPKKSLVFTPGPIEVVVGDPIETAGFTQKDLPELMERTRQAILAYHRGE
ncbi:MAG TPA: lysophospholipid acyltransferase family protein [Syntrophales bacterium]|nr:lysophospholipid acyltransferase family protein [Syntrophales bacterium]HOL59671.1 lysophospholipid acyltransferase family protein [Syntrophales bacterium]HPO35817.1 lysophospholipid acyltransferase family protein [Syntrophales bacterium]